MKTLFLTVFLAVLSFFSTNANNSMLFPQYEEGYAILRGGARATTQFNYDKAEQRMLFIDDEGRSMLLVSDNVIAVVIGERTFVPARDNEAFNERIIINDNALFVRHRVEVRTDTSGDAAFGARQISATHTDPSGQGMSVIGSSNTTTAFVHRDISDPSIYFRDQSMIFIHDGNRFVEINSLRRLTRQFDRAQRSQIEDFARRNNTNFRDAESVKAITVYALSL